MTAYRLPVQPITAQKRPRKQDKAHLIFVASLPCCVCGDPTSTEAAHLRFAAEPIKRQVGKGERPDDWWCVPLCGRCHRRQHAEGERRFWGMNRERVMLIALSLFVNTGNHELGEQIVRAR